MRSDRDSQPQAFCWGSPFQWEILCTALPKEVVDDILVGISPDLTPWRLSATQTLPTPKDVIELLQLPAATLILILRNDEDRSWTARFIAAQEPERFPVPDLIGIGRSSKEAFTRLKARTLQMASRMQTIQ